MKKILKFFCSMKFALILLIILALACTAGSIIPQGNNMTYYTQNYSTQIAGAIMLLGLNDVFHCGWFIVLTLILCGNLLGCNVLRFPSLIKRTKTGFTAEKRMAGWNKVPVAETMDAEGLFKALSFRKITAFTTEDGKNGLYAVKNIIGIWGAWLTHLGMLIVIIGFGLGQVMKVEYTVYGVPGDKLHVGDTPYEIMIDDFETILREDDTVEQYTSWLTVANMDTGEVKQGETQVNNPLSLFGMKFYQNSTGWAATVQLIKNEEVLQEDVLCAGEYMELESLPGVAIMFSAFYPDYVRTADGNSMTQSSKLNNPGYLYMLYHGNQVMGMNVLLKDEVINLDDYQIVFKDPQQYTLIQIKRDPFTLVAAVGGLLVMFALILAFYIRTAEIWAVQQEDGRWMVAGMSKKGGAEFLEQIKISVEDQTKK